MFRCLFSLLVFGVGASAQELPQAPVIYREVFFNGIVYRQYFVLIQPQAQQPISLPPAIPQVTYQPPQRLSPMITTPPQNQLLYSDYQNYGQQCVGRI